MGDEVVRVMVVDDHSMVHIGLAGMMEAFDGIELAGEVFSGEEAIARVHDLKPDVILMDLVLPNIDGIEAARQIKAIHPKVHILILTSYENSADIHKAISAGAVGYLLKNVTATELERAIRSASQGQITLAPEAAKALVEYSQTQKSAARDLTERELEVLRFVARGFSNAQVAAQLVVSPFTVKAHVSNILAKLEVATRAEAAAYAVQHNLVKLD
jgi:NarL family two-component system response regulator LiaR